MAWFSKPKDSRPAAPALCARCGARPGTALVRFVAGPEAQSPGAAGRAAWLCDACQDEVRREGAHN